MKTILEQFANAVQNNLSSAFQSRQHWQHDPVTKRLMKKHLHTARQPKVIRTALHFSLIVGPILVFINHGDAIIAGTMDSTAWLKSALTMLVPYTVSTLSSVSAYHSCRSDNEEEKTTTDNDRE